MKKYSRYMERKTQYYQDVISLQIAPYTKISANYFVDIEKTDSEIYMEKQKTQNSQYNIKKRTIQRTDTTQLQDLL